MKKEMERFLLETYFGISEVEDYDPYKLTKECANRAYLDLARRIPYLHSLTEIESMKNTQDVLYYVKRKADFKDGVISYIADQIKARRLPKDVIERLLVEAGKYEDLFKEPFCFGLSQKWVNMTYKYLWLFDRCPIQEKELYAPLDSYIIDYL